MLVDTPESGHLTFSISWQLGSQFPSRPGARSPISVSPLPCRWESALCERLCGLAAETDESEYKRSAEGDGGHPATPSQGPVGWDSIHQPFNNHKVPRASNWMCWVDIYRLGTGLSSRNIRRHSRSLDRADQWPQQPWWVVGRKYIASQRPQVTTVVLLMLAYTAKRLVASFSP